MNLCELFCGQNIGASASKVRISIQKSRTTVCRSLVMHGLQDLDSESRGLGAALVVCDYCTPNRLEVE